MLLRAPILEFCHREDTDGSRETLRSPPAGSAQATYRSKAFTVNEEYSWAVEGNAQIDSVYREGGFVDITFSQTGTNTITVNDGEYAGSLTVTVE